MQIKPIVVAVVVVFTLRPVETNSMTSLKCLAFSCTETAEWNMNTLQ